MDKRTFVSLIFLCVGALQEVNAQVDLSGPWQQRRHEDLPDRVGGPDIGDYTGIPINTAARMRADTWNAQKWSIPEHQCEPHPADYIPQGPGHMVVHRELDPNSLLTRSWQTISSWMTPKRTIWMDGRPGPSPDEAHTWQGFSTGKWVGDTLVVTTTHLKEGWLRRNGVPRSDKAKLTEFYIRRENTLTLFAVIEDPVYLAEPFVRSWNWVLNPGYTMARYTCEPRVETERPEGYVAHWLPGANPMLREFPLEYALPQDAANGGAQTMYPAYLEALEKSSAK
jgi:hypothetical protein